MLESKNILDTLWFGFPLLEKDSFNIDKALSVRDGSINSSLELCLDNFLKENIDSKKKL